MGELILTDYEKGYLTAVYDTVASVEAKEYHKDYPEENSWFMQAVGDRTFDLCIWLTDEDDIDSEQVCVVHECYLDNTGSYTTHTERQYYLKEANCG